MSEDQEEKATLDPGDKIAVSLSFKKNLGNYQSLDVYTSASITVRHSEGEDEAYKRAWDIVERQLENELEKIQEELKKD